MSDSQIGQRVKKLRQKRKITLKQLSYTTGLSVGFLSQFERGISTIAIDSLTKIAEAFQVNLVEFLQAPPTQESVVVKSFDQKNLDLIGENYIVRRINAGQTKHSLYPRIVEILPHREAEEVSTYAHEGEEFIYMIEGIMTLLYKNEIHHLYPGDCAHYLSTEPHNWTNQTSRIARFLIVSYPNPFHDDDHDNETWHF